MTQHDPKHVIDVICGVLGGTSAPACLFAFDLLPLLIQILSLLSLAFTIFWFGVRTYDRFIKRD